MKLRNLITGLMIGIAAFAADRGAELFQKAVTQERAAGNLEEAIKLYQRVVKEFASDRALAAKALVQEARCYEKLGQDKAVKLYEQVARDFKDQREPAAAASARLATLRQPEHAAAAPATMTQRRIELMSSGSARLWADATDGQNAVYTDDATGALMISDLSGRNKRVILKPKSGVLRNPGASRDSAMVLMTLIRPDGSQTIAVIKTDGTGYREIRGSIHSCRPTWSWDNRYVLICEKQPDGKIQLLRVSVTDGETRTMMETHSFVHTFSPDGRYIAYADELYRFGKVFVVPSEGGEPQLVSSSGRLMDWTRDGRNLVVDIDRSGSEALYLVPIKDGKQAGDPVFVRYGSFEMGKITAGGALVYLAAPRGGEYTSWLGTLESDGLISTWKRLSLSGSGNATPAPTWSPDSAQIAYTSPDFAAGQSTWVIRARNLANGEEREIYRGGAGEIFCLWAAQHASLFCEQYTTQGTTEVLSIPIDSGRVERLGSLPGRNPFNFVSRDESAIYMSGNPNRLVRWEISTRQATTLDQSPGLIRSPGVASPDERWIARREQGKIEIRPMGGGDWKPLVSLLNTTQVAFTPDGNWILYHGVDASGKQSLYRVATAGGLPGRIGDFPSDSLYGYLWISPDGRKIIADALDAADDLWMLENFEPKQQAAK